MKDETCRFCVLLIAIFLALTALTRATTLQYNTEYENLESGDTIDIDLHLKPPLDSIKNLLNGNITNVNFSDTAYLRQRSIDSTSANANDWMFNYTRKWQVWDTATFTGRFGRGFYIYINDTTANDRQFRIYDDSSTMLFTAEDDSVTAVVPLKAHSARVDSLQFGTGTQLKKYVESSFACTLSGCSDSPAPNGTAYYTMIGNLVAIRFPQLLGTSNSTSATVKGIPDDLQLPSGDHNCVVIIEDNGAVEAGSLQLDTDSEWTIYRGNGTAIFTNSGQKSLRGTTNGGVFITYILPTE